MTLSTQTKTVAHEVEIALARSSARHGRLCPRQVLGVRIGLAGIAILGRSFPDRERDILTIIETDGCFADGIEAASGCSVGHHTLRLQDCGRVAATFVEIASSRAVRIAPRPGVRTRAAALLPAESRPYDAQLQAYQVMPVDDLLRIEEVELQFDLAALIGRRGCRVNCISCGEEVVNGREQLTAMGPLCPACAGAGYYCPR